MFEWLDTNLIGPLEPITDFLAASITIRNFPSLPYSVGVLGQPRCKTRSEAGYSSSFKNDYKKQCKENCSSGYKETSSKCKETCASIGYEDDK